MVSPDLSPEQFFTEVYDQTLLWMTGHRRAQTLAQFDHQIVRKWTKKLTHEDGVKIPVNLDLKKAVILEDSVVILAMALGRFPRRWAEEINWGLQFGVKERGMLSPNQKPIDWLRCCVDPYIYPGTGDFYVYPTGSQDLWNGSLINNRHRLGTISPMSMNECIRSIQEAARIVVAFSH